MPLSLPPSLPGLIQPVTLDHLCTTRAVIASGEAEASFLAASPSWAKQYRLIWKAKIATLSEIEGRFAARLDGQTLSPAEAIFTLTFDTKRIDELRDRRAVFEVTFPDGSTQRRDIVPFHKPGWLSRGPIIQSIVIAIEPTALSGSVKGVVARIVLPDGRLVVEASFAADALSTPHDLAERVIAAPFDWDGGSNWRCSVQGWK